MRWALLLYEETAKVVDEPDQAMAELGRYMEVINGLEAEGVPVDGEVFMPIHDARNVSVVDGEVQVTTPEVPELELGGYVVVECDEQRAMEIAASLPIVTHGHVEVRPLFEVPDGSG